MNPESYKTYQEFQKLFFHFMSDNGPVEEVFWNELFQQMLNTAFEVFKKHE